VFEFQNNECVDIVLSVCRKRPYNELINCTAKNLFFYFTYKDGNILNVRTNIHVMYVIKCQHRMYANSNGIG
jgi:hypothetical protein